MESIHWTTIFTMGARRLCWLFDLMVLLVSVCALWQWVRVKKQRCSSDIKNIMLLRWPRLLLAMGIAAGLVGMAMSIDGVIGTFFRMSHHPPTFLDLLSDCSLALISLIHGIAAFVISLIQYMIYVHLAKRMNKREL